MRVARGLSWDEKVLYATINYIRQKEADMGMLAMDQVPEALRNKLERFCEAVEQGNAPYLMGCFTEHGAYHAAKMDLDKGNRTGRVYAKCTVLKVDSKGTGYRVVLQLDHETRTYWIATNWIARENDWVIDDAELLPGNQSPS